MYPCVQTLKIKGIWIVIICTFFSLFYVAHQLKVASISKPFAFIEIVGGKSSFIEVGSLKDNDKEKPKIVLSESNIFRGLTTEKSANLKISPQKNNDVNLLIRTSGINATTEPSSNESYVSNATDSAEKAKVKTKIGVLIPSSTRKVKNPSLGNLSLTNICLPSLQRTLEKEYTYVIYVGIDIGDYLESVKDKLETMFENVKAVVSRGKTFTKSVNAIARVAYQDGMDYLVRINDDSSFESLNWTSNGISVLQNYSPPNIGVVGPTCHQGNTAILTHDMVHRTHLDIFDFYYPPYFDNWWADNWITEVYSPERSTKLSTWLIKHHIGSHGTRYNVDFKKHVRLNKTLVFDRERLGEYLNHIKHYNRSLE